MIERLVVGHNVSKLHKMIVSSDDTEFKHVIVMSGLMVTGMCLLMTLYATVVSFGSGAGFWSEYIFNLVRNYPVALLAQLLVVCPLTRFLFVRLVSAKSL